MRPDPLSRGEPTTPPSSYSEESPITLALASSTPLAVPNKHLATPIYTVTPNRPQNGPATPPASPPSKSVLPVSRTPSCTSVLSNTSGFNLRSKSPPVYGIDVHEAAEAIEQMSSQPLPETDRAFPWLHGIHPENQTQLAYFNLKHRIAQLTGSCFRGVTIVKIGRTLESSKLKGAILPNEILRPSSQDRDFIDVDPKVGFGIRNFHIQAAKLATVSDIIVYGADSTNAETVMKYAAKISAAQTTHRRDQLSIGNMEFPKYHTFLVESPFSAFEKSYPHLVAYDSNGINLGQVPDFAQLERIEMGLMSKATELSHNVYMGSTLDRGDFDIDSESPYNLLIECCDQVAFPSTSTLKLISRRVRDNRGTMELEFPASGSIQGYSRSRLETTTLVATCRWLYTLAHAEPPKDADGDSDMKRSGGFKILLHCLDGYTETSLLALAYLMYSEGIQAHEAWVRLHMEKGRNFFAYASDMAVLSAIQDDILLDSPVALSNRRMSLKRNTPGWVQRMDGSLPSRILPHMYLGNLCHANNPALLKELGITRILSIGEAKAWTCREELEWDEDNLMYIDNCQDNGVDLLTPHLDKCLRFIEKGRLAGEATLVHCRVGVSRSATICIAEVVKSLNLSVARAYCYVRARRLNVIIQPHLRFMYELLKWEEKQKTTASLPYKRDLEWATISREIANLNRPYSKS